MRSDSEMVNLRSVIETLCYMVDEDSDGVEEIMQLPSIDLVRCGECKYWGNSYICWRRRAKPIAMNPDDFCSYGERKENE